MQLCRVGLEIKPAVDLKLTRGGYGGIRRVEADRADTRLHRPGGGKYRQAAWRGKIGAVERVEHIRGKHERHARFPRHLQHERE